MMSIEDEEKLEVKRPKLMRGLKLEDGLLLAELRAQKVITQHQEEIVNQQGPNTLRAGKLVDYLRQGDCSTLGHFIDAMLATNHAALVEECFGTNTATDLPTRPPLDLSNPDFCYARHLAEDTDARDRFLEILRRESESMVPRGSLLEVVRKVGFNEKRLVYLVFLVPKVCEQIGRLFVIKRVRTRNGWISLNFQYYMDLLKACKYNVQSKDTLIKALVDAEVTVETPLATEALCEATDDWFNLLQQLSNKQRDTLLQKTHNIQLRVNDEQQSTISPTEYGSVYANDFVLAVAYMYDCAIVADYLEISYVDIPVCMLTRNMSGVKRLHLSTCKLCKAVPGYMPTRDTLSSLQHQPPSQKKCSLEEVEFYEVKGMAHLQHCGTVTSRPCRLGIYSCDDVTAGDLKKCCPEVYELQVTAAASHSTEANVVSRGTDQPATDDSINAPIGKNLAEMCPFIQAYDQSLKKVKLTGHGFLNVEHNFEIEVSGISQRNDTLLCEILVEYASFSIRRLLDACSPHLQCRKLKVEDSHIRFNEGDISNTRYDSLEELEVSRSRNPIDLAQVLSFCSRSQLKVVNILCATLLIEDERINTIQQMPELKTNFRFTGVSVSKPDGTAWNSGRTDALVEILQALFPLGEVDIVRQ